MDATSRMRARSKRSMRRVADMAALRVLVNAQVKANEIVRQATDEAESLRADARAYVKAVAYEAAALREEAEALRTEQLKSLREVAEKVGAEIDLDESFDRYIDLDLGDDPAKDWILGSRG